MTTASQCPFLGTAVPGITVITVITVPGRAAALLLPQALPPPQAQSQHQACRGGSKSSSLTLAQPKEGGGEAEIPSPEF